MEHLALATNEPLLAPPSGGDATRATSHEQVIPAAPSALVHAEVYRYDGEPGAGHVATATAIAMDDLIGCLRAVFPQECEDDLWLALVAVYLFRTAAQPKLAIAVCERSAEAGPPAGTAREAGYAPLLLDVGSGETFATVLEAVKDERRSRAAPHGAGRAASGVDGSAAIARSATPQWATPQWATPFSFAITLTDDVAAWTAGNADVELVVDTKNGKGLLHVDARFLPEFAGVVVDHLKTLAHAVAAGPVAPVGQLSCLSTAERQRVVEEWNSTAFPYPFDGGLVARLEDQARKAPDHPAVVFQGTTLTYAQFNARVNRLARYLRGAGVGPDTFVAICLDRSIEMVVGIWAVLKAGGAYVPLNVEDPPQRLALIIRNAGAGFVLTDDRLAKKLPRRRIKIIRLSPEDPAIGREDCDDLKLPIAENQLAYMIYTSGSTGEPKGVLIEHEAIHNRIMWMQEKYNLGADDRVLQKTPYTFDVSVWEFLWPLTVGAALVVAEPGGHVVPSYLSRLMWQEKITCVHFVPSVLRLFLRCPGLEKLGLRLVFCSGEALGTDLRDALFARLPCELHNLYGPTEAAVDVSFYACRDNPRSRRVPIGRPIANIRLHVLDEDLRPVPVGVAGELHIGGVGLARGYWRRPELTVERFIDDPLRNEAGQRLYKTGDVARYLPDGNIEYLGRTDHQVKINGARVELGEIEAIIRAHSMVRDAVVVAKKEDSGNAQLIAFLVMKESGKGTAALNHLREHLDRRLPPHMIPRSFTVLPRIPLTSSGKVDRKALPEPRPDA
jgi:amino acid adenylation domain-containing protein